MSQGIVLLHGFASSPQSKKTVALAKVAEEQSIAVRAPQLDRDDFEHLTVTNMVEDARAALFDRSLVVGSSLGAWVAALTAAEDKRVQALLLLAPAFDFVAGMKDRFGAEALAAWKKMGDAPVMHHAHKRMLRLHFGFLTDAELHVPLPPLTVSTLIVHGIHDDVIAPSGITWAESQPGVEQVLRVDADHQLLGAMPQIIDAMQTQWARFDPSPT